MLDWKWTASGFAAEHTNLPGEICVWVDTLRLDTPQLYVSPLRRRFVSQKQLMMLVTIADRPKIIRQARKFSASFTTEEKWALAAYIVSNKAALTEIWSSCSLDTFDVIDMLKALPPDWKTTYVRLRGVLE